jgi:hypothetical protein
METAGIRHLDLDRLKIPGKVSGIRVAKAERLDRAAQAAKRWASAP